MSKYSRLMVQPLYNDINSTISKLKEFLIHPVNINVKNNNTIPVLLISNNLDKVYNDSTINGSIKNILAKLTKLKLIVENIINAQDLNNNIENLRLRKYNVDGSINVNITNKINVLEDELNSLERKIDIGLNNL